MTQDISKAIIDKLFYANESDAILNPECLCDTLGDLPSYDNATKVNLTIGGSAH